MSNLNRRLNQICSRVPDKPALIQGAESVPFGQLWRMSVAAGMFLDGATRRPNVGLLLPAVKEFAPLYFGTLLAGKAAVPLNFLLAPGELAAVVKDAQLDCVLTSRVLGDRIPKLESGVICVEDIASSLIAAAGTPPIPGFLDRAFAVPTDSPATIIYTAGTSGPPKGVVLSHANLLANTDSCVELLGLSESDVLLASLPFFHAFGLATGLVMPVLFGGSTVLLPRFTPGALVDLVEKHRVNIILTIPTMWTVLVKTGHLSPRLGTLRTCISGGEPLPGSTYDAFHACMGFPILEGYGLTECSPVVALTPPHRPVKGSVGTPLPGVEVRVVGPDGDELCVGEEGELHVRGPNVMLGYHNRPDLTASVLNSDGWFATGDRGSFDDQGLLHVTGRQKDLIITGGENVSPREIEEVLLTCPGIIEAAVIGVTEGSRGEVIKAFVVLAPGASVSETDIKVFCRKSLASYKVPRHVRFIDSLPRSFTGKVLKRSLPT